MLIRALTTLEDCRRVSELEKLVWGYTDTEDIIPPIVLIISVKRGGILLGAFDDDGSMKGFVYSVPGLKDGRVMQWSHMLGVVADARSSGVGLRLKLAQREKALELGTDLVEWTYDPLQTLNAHLNFARLGVVVEEYAENIYGDSSSPLHRGTPTDRFIAAWYLREPHVERRIAAAGQPLVRDAAVARAPIVNPSSDGARWIRPGAPDLTLEDRRLFVEIPTGFSEMLREDPALALEWRLGARRIFQHYLSRGYRVVDFFEARNQGRGRYLLAQRDGTPTP